MVLINNLLLVSLLAAMCIGIFIFFKGYKKPENILLAILAFFISIWTIASYFYRIIPPTSHNLILLLAKTEFIFGTLIATIFLHFALVFSKQIKKQPGQNF